MDRKVLVNLNIDTKYINSWIVFIAKDYHQRIVYIMEIEQSQFIHKRFAFLSHINQQTFHLSQVSDF